MTYGSLSAFRDGTGQERANGGVGTSMDPGLYGEAFSDAPTISVIRKIGDELEPYFDVNSANARTPMQVSTGGIDLSTSNLGKYWWLPKDPQNLFDTYWMDTFRSMNLPLGPQDFFKHPVPDSRSGTFSMGASQFKSP